MADVHVGDIGTIIRLTIVDEDGDAVDVSGATTKQIVIGKPDGTVLTKAASFTDDGADGQIEYATVEGDLDIPGQWRAQGAVAITGWSGRSAEITIPVKPIIA